MIQFSSCFALNIFNKWGDHSEVEEAFGMCADGDN